MIDDPTVDHDAERRFQGGQSLLERLDRTCSLAADSTTDVNGPLVETTAAFAAPVCRSVAPKGPRKWAPKRPSFRLETLHDALRSANKEPAAHAVRKIVCQARGSRAFGEPELPVA
jgi:hypothetical protein